METRTMGFSEIYKEMEAKGVSTDFLSEYSEAIGGSMLCMRRLVEMWPGIRDLDFKGLRVLDIGCGSPISQGYLGGIFHPSLARGFAKLGAKVTGVDMRPGYAKDIYTHVQMDLAKMSMREVLSDGSFDLATCTEFFTDMNVSNSMWRNGKGDSRGFLDITKDVYALLRKGGRYMLHGAMGEEPLQILTLAGFDAHQKSRILDGEDDRIFFCRK